MITGQTKNQIDRIWNTFWETGGITNPITVLEQMTYLFFIKLIDDEVCKREKVSMELGVQYISDGIFDYGNKGTWVNPETNEEVDINSLRWHVFKNLEAGAMYKKVQRDVFPYIKTLNKGENSAYSRFMQNATFLIASPRALQKIVDDIDTLNMTDRDTMGDVYEYMLGKMASSGQNGQFRTPRHIIRMMVELMQPSLNDSICDPAMGSAGFIVEAAKYVKKHYEKELMNEQKEEHFKRNMLHGYDTDQTMLRIGAMNLMLHDITNPDVEFRDSLSSENTDTNKYTLILANPPFAGSLDNDMVAPSLLSTTKTKKTELLFLSLFLRSLTTGGRCASIVPDGVLTGSSKAHKAIRKAIIDGNRLEAVISMPSGVFQPYSGVSTAVLIFTKTGHGGTDKVWFYDMKADGFSLDLKRNEVPENDIPDIIERFHSVGPDVLASSETHRKRTDQSFLVPVEEIREHDYDLAFNTYKETIREAVVYEPSDVILSRIDDRHARIGKIFSRINHLIVP
ncbi:MAG: SAM-dependent DNA methyltransferase [Muribaculaceae bacterium]|nr:SAM-dependent DNA methyltransferase [Muribaculaceae bacterium]